jgi:uncharacterized membrane protein YeiH
MVQAAGSARYLWVAAFLAVGVLFNPALPISLPRKVFLAVDLLSLVVFVVSLATLKLKPRLSLASMTGSIPGESL